MSLTDSEVRKKKLVVILLVIFLLVVLLAVAPTHRGIWQVVMNLTPTAATAVVQVPTATATTVATSTPTATATATAVPSTSTPTATATPVPPTSTPTATATATPVPPTSTPTATATPTPSPTPTLDPSIVHPVPKGVMPVTDELDAPVITSPEGDLETKETEIAIGGTAPANARVVVYDNQFPLGMVVADGEGEWQYEPPEPWSEEEHVIVARTTDGERISQPSDPVRVVVLGERLPITGRGRTIDSLIPGWSLTLVQLVVIGLVVIAGLFGLREKD